MREAIQKDMQPIRIYNKTMIRENVLYIKLFRQKPSSKQMFEDYMASFRPEEETCPCCQAKGGCRIHAYYTRRIIDFVRGVPTMAKIRVLRVICTGCRHTHAILPDCIIPYARHSLTFFLQVLSACSRRNQTADEICERFGLEMTTFHRWKILYREHKALWLGVLKDRQLSEHAFLMSLSRLQEIPPFLSAFYSLTGFSFLQRHRNPEANSDRCALP